MKNWFSTLTLLASFTLYAFSIEQSQHENAGRLTEKSRECRSSSAQIGAKELTKPAQDILVTKSMMEAYGFTIPSAEQISLWRKESLRKEKATLYLQQKRIAPLTSLNVEILIYLQDCLGWSNPTPNHIVTILNLMGLESFVIGTVKT